MSTETWVSASVWQSGMISAVRLAAMIPARRAASSALPFFTCPARTRRRAAALTVMNPSATASRAVTGLSPTSTIRRRPASSTWVSNSRFDMRALASCQEERQTFERDRQIHALELHVRRYGQRPRRKIEHRFHSRADDEVHDVLRSGCGNGDDGDADVLLPDNALELTDVVDGDAAL